MRLVTNSPALVWKLMRSFSGRLRQREHTYTDTLKARNQELAETNARLAEANASLEHMNQNLEALVDARTKQLAEANARLEDLAAHDQVTGLYNRRYLQDTLDHKANMIARAAYPFAIIMVDIDNFKHYNDRNGHLAGDGVLRKVAELLRGVIRGGDVIARYGGEEFCILLENAALEDAMRVAEKLRAAISEHDFPKGSYQPLGMVSISLGVAAFPETARDVVAVLSAADKALYRAKETGRNRVVTASPVESPPSGP
jgi:diguanylate cyclase (GGDEF)-like protein